MNDIDVREIRERHGLTQEMFAKMLCVSRKTIQNWEGGSSIPKTKSVIFNNIETLIKQWYEDSGSDLSVSEDVLEYKIEDHKRFKPKIYDLQKIPLYDSNATLGLEEIFHNTERGNILEYIAIPNLPKSDGAILMTGDSMYPLLKSGDIAILKIINKDDMVYGDIHYIEYFGKRGGDPLKTIKYVRKSDKGEGFIKLIAYNAHHDPDDIEINKIKTVAILNASVRYHRL